MDLLLMGFRPIIADIDVVWLSDPLPIVREQAQGVLREDGTRGGGGGFDVLITDDNGEVCGCFVALNNTEPAIAL